MGFVNVAYVRQVGFFRWLSRYPVRQFTKRILKRDSRMRLPTGSSIILPRESSSSTSVYVTKANIDWGSEELFAQHASRDRDFLDIGSHIGYYSVYLHPLVRQAYAFEPDPRNLPGLRANASLAGNIEVLPIAVSSCSGTAQLDIAGDSSVSTIASSNGESIEVRKTSIDDFVAGLPKVRPALVKIDAEGHDLDVLMGMRETIARNQPVILIECSSEKLLGLCAEWHYSLFAFTCDKASMKMTFRQLHSPRDLQEYWIKMTFLVPRHLLSSFTQYCGTPN